MDIERAFCRYTICISFFYITMALKSQKEEVEGLSLNYCTVEKPVGGQIHSPLLGNKVDCYGIGLSYGPASRLWQDGPVRQPHAIVNF
jgi:hypothetical protein